MKEKKENLLKWQNVNKKNMIDDYQYKKKVTHVHKLNE